MTPKNSEVDRRDALSGDRTTPIDLVSLRTPCPETHEHEYWRPSRDSSLGADTPYSLRV
jgi:hypothetical protein